MTQSPHMAVAGRCLGRLWLLLAILAGLLVGCGDPHAHRYTQTRPKPADLVGPWAPGESFGVPSHPAARLTLAADGVFECSELPVDDNKNPPGITTITGRGAWQLVRRQQWWAVEFTLPQPNGPTTSRLLMVCGESPPYSLCLGIDDPDVGRAYFYERRAGEQSSSSSRATGLSLDRQAPWASFYR